MQVNYSDPDSTVQDTVASCGAEKPTGAGGAWTCTEPLGHAGDHLAANPDGFPFAAWPQEARKPQLTADQRRHVERAREVQAAAVEIGEGADPAMAYATQLGAVQWHLGEMLALIGQLTGGAS